jgi:hypothetical protein
VPSGTWLARQRGGNQFTLANTGFEDVSDVRLTSDSVTFDGPAEWRMIPRQYQVLVTTVENLDPRREITLSWRSAHGNAESRPVG